MATGAASGLGKATAAGTDRLDVLVHNAGVLPRHRELGAAGQELTFATHVLGPLLLTDLLRPLLAASLPGFHRPTRPLLRNAEEGADTAVWPAADPVPGGRFWHDRAERPTHVLPGAGERREDVEAFWRYCADAAGITP
ncbi:hypothetical protein [Lentzea sp. CC55]|uniref:hypothetical protein n=1 Tax=Lentzea sp. CC55 TaxID=2884909 RepID=UPI001F2440CD|nr:hypothetical protein [Lentzea sp. CC55]MCG8927240.1 hypothetical protein [Lentzea sp. CC55]